MADNLRKYTTQEVLNKVYTDSSGNSIGLNAATSKETLNAVLTSGADSLNVALSGGTISGDVTIAGDLVVQGGGSQTFSETVTDNVSGNYAMFIENQHSNGLGLAVRAGASGSLNILSLQNATQATMFSVKTNGNIDVAAGGVLQMTNSTINGSPINLLSKDTAIDEDEEGVRIRFGKSDGGFLADFGYRRYRVNDKGATVTSTDKLRFVLAGQDVSHFMFTGGNSDIGPSMDIRTHETTVVANDVLGKITFSAPYELSGTDAILAGAEIKALATAEFTSSVNSTDLIFSTASSGAAVEAMRIESDGDIQLHKNLYHNAATIGHGMTTLAPSAAWAGFKIREANNGGLNLQGYTDADDSALTLLGVIGVTDPTDTVPAVIIQSGKKSGTSGQALAADETVLRVDNWSTQGLVTVLGDGRVGIGTTSIPHGGVGKAKFAIEGVDSNQNTGPNIQITTNADDYPLFQMINYSHDNIGLNFDCYFDGAWKSSDAGSNYQIYKTNDQLKFLGDTGVSAGSSPTFVTMFALDDNSRISLSNNDSGGTGGADSSSGNTIFGNLAGANLDSGSINNILIGHHAGKGLSGSTNDYTGNVLIGGNSGRDITQGDENVAVGYNAGRYIQQGDSNTLIGHNAGNAVLNSNNNTIVGANAGDAISSGANNSILGTAALGTATTALNNVFIGRSAGEDIPASQALDGAVAIGWEAFKGGGSTTTGANYTIAIGKEALKSLTTGGQNVAIGYESGKDITTGASNTLLGYGAGKNIDTASQNVALGAYAGWKLGDADADANVFIGMAAGAGGDATDANNTASNNVGIGQKALGGTTYSSDGTALTCTGNVAIGYQAMTAIENGSLNVAIGEGALDAGTTATSNVAIGKNALGSNVGGGYTIAIGRECFADMNDDCNDGSIGIGYAAGKNIDVSAAQFSKVNICIGKQAGVALETGGYNTVVGNAAMGGDFNYTTALTGGNNAVFGYGAGYPMEGASSNNSLFGSSAGNTITTGSNNVCVGYDADVSVAAAANQIVIGQGVTGTGNNEIALGNTSISAIKAQVTSITAYSSDERTKKDIKDYDLKGLDFVNDLQLKTYIYKNPADFPDEIRSSKWDEDGVEKPEDPTEVQVGLIAQEVEAALSKHGIGNTETYAPTQDNGIKTLTYGNLIFPLIKAVQELSARVEELESK